MVEENSRLLKFFTDQFQVSKDIFKKSISSLTQYNIQLRNSYIEATF
jgi:hypothetical protein